MGKFCCEKFKFHYNGPNEMGLNFRVIKLSPKFAEKGRFGDDIYRVMIAEGYTKLSQAAQKIVIGYCPFCGTKLSKLYASDKFVNETDHEF